MRKTLLIAFILSVVGYNAQQSCAFDEVQEKLEKQFPENREARLAAEAKILSMDINSFLKKKGLISNTGKYTGTVYEIPVVVHVIESAASGLTVSDADIQTWIDNANAMYAGTYGNGFYSSGDNIGESAVIPFKLALAQRSPNCTETTGIVRYDGSGITDYNDYGVLKDGTSGATQTDIRTLAPHWPENAYYNIYLVIAFDGYSGVGGLMGFAYLPSTSDSSYDAFMKYAVVTRTNDSTLAHEFGHSMGLLHPFQGASSSGGECPANDDCTTDNDKVCDTSPTESLLYGTTPDNTETNPCTGENYDDVQYNIMNYTNAKRKFTAGQRERAMALFLSLRNSLTTSLGATALTGDDEITIASASCSPTAITNVGNKTSIGPTLVSLEDINVSSTGYYGSTGQYYIDYSQQSCISSVFTDIPKTSASTISIGIGGGNNQCIKAWIDYNNDGAFDDSTELVANTGGSYAVASSPFTATFTPPSDAVTDTYLRMRVRADWSCLTSCQDPSYGQVEDYAVRIIDSTLGIKEAIKTTENIVLYNNQENALYLYGKNADEFGQYKIFDMNGKLVQSGDENSDKIILNNNQKGVFMIQYGSKNTVKKFKK